MRILSRVVAGTIVYVIIVVLAAPFPGAAGLMLTFPALNGLSFFYEGRERAPAMAKSMLWMPVLNGALCAGYIVAFLGLARVVAPNVLAWLLFAAVIALWVGLVFRKTVDDGIAPQHQIKYGIASTIVGVLLVALALCVASYLHSPRMIAAPEREFFSSTYISDIVWSNRRRVGLFALCLAVFLVATAYSNISDAKRGILAGLPLVPFGGLLSVASDDELDIVRRLDILASMGVSVWLSPAAPIWFVYGYSRYLEARRPSDGTARDALMRFSVLLLGWLLCGAAICAITLAIYFTAR